MKCVPLKRLCAVEVDDAETLGNTAAKGEDLIEKFNKFMADNNMK